MGDGTLEETWEFGGGGPRRALPPRSGGGPLQGIALKVVEIARAGLKRRNRRDRMGERDESPFLNELLEIAETGRTLAEIKLDEFRGPWNGSVDPLFREYAY